jgi:hypothetical protein
MGQALQVLAILLVAVAMSLALAHALEMPGKLRLSEPEYRMVQQIFYPGFTIAGGCEPLAILVLLALVIVARGGGIGFWLELASLVMLAAMHGVYWRFVHPTNKVWVRDLALDRSGARFFAAVGAGGAAGWTRWRDQWEYAHVARAALAFLGLTALAVALVLR